MNIKNLLIPICTATGLLLAVAWMAGLFTKQIAPDLLERHTDNVLSSYIVKTTTKPILESIPAVIKAREATLLSSQILARIENIHVRAGENVKKRQLLVTLESKGLTAQLAQAIAMKGAAQTLLTQAKANFKCTNILKYKGLVSQSELDDTVASFRRYESEFVAATQSQQAAQIAVEYSIIKSPFSGVVVARSSEPGDMALPGQLLLSLYDPLTLQIEADVRESLAIQLKIGRIIIVKIDSLDKTINAAIVETVPAADPNTRSYLVKAGMQFNPNLRPGMFARMLIEYGTEDVLLIPVDYLKSYGQLDMVLIVKDKVVNRRFVRLGKTDLHQVEVISGLNAGDVLALKANVF
jgi:membrane fusion protein (multidrug efflux system)